VSRRLVVLLALLGPFLLAGCSGLQGTDDDVATGNGAIVQVDPSDRQGPVEIAGSTLQGKPIDLADFRGRVVVLNVWGSWCAPCITEAPRLQEASENLDAQFVGLSFKETSVDNGLGFERDHGITYPTIYDRGDKILALGRYAPTAPPTTYVLDRKGRVAALITGAVRSIATLEDLVDEVAAEDRPASGSSDAPSDGPSDG
jgi:thiol-disulfide isomerase/thioredoxin